MSAGQAGALNLKAGHCLPKKAFTARACPYAGVQFSSGAAHAPVLLFLCYSLDIDCFKLFYQACVCVVGQAFGLGLAYVEQRCACESACLVFRIISVLRCVFAGLNTAQYVAR